MANVQGAVFIYHTSNGSTVLLDNYCSYFQFYSPIWKINSRHHPVSVKGKQKARSRALLGNSKGNLGFKRHMFTEYIQNIFLVKCWYVFNAIDFSRIVADTENGMNFLHDFPLGCLQELRRELVNQPTPATERSHMILHSTIRVHECAEEP